MEGGGENQMRRCWKFLQIKLHIKRKGINLVDTRFHEFLTFLRGEGDLYLHSVGPVFLFAV